MTPTIEDADYLAATYHHGQVDKAGRPYIGHVVKVGVRATGSATGGHPVGGYHLATGRSIVGA